MDTPQSLRETIAACKRDTDEPLLFRLDPDNDPADDIDIFMDSGCSFITKRSLRRESELFILIPLAVTAL